MILVFWRKESIIYDHDYQELKSFWSFKLLYKNLIENRL